MSKYKRTERVDVLQNSSVGKEVLVVVLNSKRLSRGVYDLKGLTFGEVEDLMSEEGEDVQFYIENEEERKKKEKREREREWIEGLISKREGFRMLIHEAKLKNCPFCRGKSKMHLYLGKYYVTCKKCKSYSAPYNTVEEAEAAWNRRDEPNELERHH